ncbi:ethanolamine utilization protein EutN [Floricoccus tropicus]|uniref:Ethanolamine utilization protein EutN n=1 Tax=Floricoccus tropicus TaxID=1859473 RepID=A0A1E8GNR2_9LACT|nr:EutN/CcmL family microcompartment protein [Floricoccus tropicus]OFI49904.1 ethanolamine utilization protein EutN [Floricoccus tropicus]
MQIGLVKGSLWATRKAEHLSGLKFLIVEIKDPITKITSSVVAADIIGAGLDDNVLITTGSAARVALENPEIPIDATIIGIIDSVELNKS